MLKDLKDEKASQRFLTEASIMTWVSSCRVVRKSKNTIPLYWSPLIGQTTCDSCMWRSHWNSWTEVSLDTLPLNLSEQSCVPLSPQHLAAFKSGVPHWSIFGFQPHLSCDRVHGKGTELTGLKLYLLTLLTPCLPSLLSIRAH